MLAQMTATGLRLNLFVYVGFDVEVERTAPTRFGYTLESVRDRGSPARLGWQSSIAK